MRDYKKMWEMKIEPSMVGMTLRQAVALKRKEDEAKNVWQPDAMHVRMLRAMQAGPRAVFELAKEINAAPQELGTRMRWLVERGLAEGVETILVDYDNKPIVPGREKVRTEAKTRYALRKEAVAYLKSKERGAQPEAQAVAS